MRLIDVCDINPRAQAIDDNLEVSFVAMPDVSEDGKINTGNIRSYCEVKKGFTCFQEGDVLFAKITPCMENGKGALAVGLKNGIGCGSTEFHVLRPNTEVLQGQWLYYLTSWSAFRKDAERHMTGSAGQKRVPKAYLEKYELQIPTLSEQLYQVKSLDRVKAVIELRKRERQSLDDLIKARFVELSENWDTREEPLSSYLKSITYGFTNPMPDADEGPWKVTAKDVVNGHVNFNTARKTTQNAFDSLTSKSKPKKGDVLLTKDGTLGRTAIVEDETICVNQSVAVLSCNERILPEFLTIMLQIPEYQREMTRNSGGGTIKHIYITKIDKMSVRIPSISDQDSFLIFVKQVDKSKLLCGKH